MTQFRSRNSGFDPASRFILFENLDAGFRDCVAIDLFCTHIKSLFETDHMKKLPSIGPCSTIGS